MSATSESRHRAEAFLAISAQYRLGDLPTEQSHPLTRDLSRLSRENPVEALRVLQGIDSHALRIVHAKAGRIAVLAQSIRRTLDGGHRIFICGCGATGRLALTLETLWRQEHEAGVDAGRVIGFMAGGDVALVKSIETFEDRPDYGEQQLLELGFACGDLLISCTEGGETPFVIGATVKAADVSENAPWFLYCNPDGPLCAAAERSKLVIADPRIEKLPLVAGPMALAGSTRMQATTVLMAAAGGALLYSAAPLAIEPFLASLATGWERLDCSFLSPFISAETAAYEQGEYLLYTADDSCAITIFTDTTERAPTFSMHPFENAFDPDAPRSLCFFVLSSASDAISAWKRILRRDPRPLTWPDIGAVASFERLRGYDFSPEYVSGRLAGSQGRYHQFAIACGNGVLSFTLDKCAYSVSVKDYPPLAAHLVLKMLLNMHSTLVMGRLGRYKGNVMTWVKPTNNKLIDRAIRNVDLLLRNKGIAIPYERIAHAVFDIMQTVPSDQSLVHAAAVSLEKRSTVSPS
jgi:N-acetylmuramic acid 6-phosphate etherase